MINESNYEEVIQYITLNGFSPIFITTITNGTFKDDENPELGMVELTTFVLKTDEEVKKWSKFLQGHWSNGNFDTPILACYSEQRFYNRCKEVWATWPELPRHQIFILKIVFSYISPW